MYCISIVVFSLAPALGSTIGIILTEVWSFITLNSTFKNRQMSLFFSEQYFLFGRDILLTHCLMCWRTNSCPNYFQVNPIIFSGVGERFRSNWTDWPPPTNFARWAFNQILWKILWMENYQNLRAQAFLGDLFPPLYYYCRYCDRYYCLRRLLWDHSKSQNCGWNWKTGCLRWSFWHFPKPPSAYRCHGARICHFPSLPLLS